MRLPGLRILRELNPGVLALGAGIAIPLAVAGVAALATGAVTLGGLLGLGLAAIFCWAWLRGVYPPVGRVGPCERAGCRQAQPRRDLRPRCVRGPDGVARIDRWCPACHREVDRAGSDAPEKPENTGD